MKLLHILIAILPFVVAAPTPPIETFRPFKLKSRGLSPSNPAFNNLYLEPYHIYPALNYAVLSLKSTQNPGVIGYLNGTATEPADDQGDLLFHFGSDEPPYGFVIDLVNATSNPIEINAGNGTQGIFIDQGIIKYHNPISGGFYGEKISAVADEDMADADEIACNNTLLYGPALQVFYKPKAITTPARCSDVELVVEYC